MLEKFKSRKFLVTLLSVICGIATLFGVAEGTVEIISSIGMIVIPNIIYVLVEGRIDARAIVDVAGDIIDELEANQKAKDTETNVTINADELYKHIAEKDKINKQGSV